MTAPAHAHATDRKLSEGEITDLREKVKTFMDEHIYPNEGFFHEHSARRNPEGIAKMKELQARTKAMGMWAPHLPAEAGGMGIGFMPYVYMNEILGRSPIAPMAFGSQAPDSGNAEILWQFGNKELQEKFMKPLVNGDIYSCYSMTEPEVSGADPTNLQTTGKRDGDEWVINGHKWFTSQGEGSTFAIVMCATELDQPPHRRDEVLMVNPRHELPAVTSTAPEAVTCQADERVEHASRVRAQCHGRPKRNLSSSICNGFLEGTPYSPQGFRTRRTTLVAFHAPDA